MGYLILFLAQNKCYATRAEKPAWIAQCGLFSRFLGGTDSPVTVYADRGSL